jgi:hypothetical protein
MISRMRRSTRGVLLFALVLAALSRGRLSAQSAGTHQVVATIEASMPSANGQIRQFAFDRDPGTFFASSGKPAGDDHLTLRFEKPVAIHSVRVLSGRSDGTDKLDTGTLCVSTLGERFDEVAKFARGEARCGSVAGTTKAVRIQPGRDLRHPLVIREIAIESEPPVATFTYPVEFVVDVVDAPEMKEWAERAARVCEHTYPMINDELRSEGFKPPHLVAISITQNYRGVAATSGAHITGSLRYFEAHPDDVGAMVHETVHVVQSYRWGDNPSWLVEGVSDYIRFFKFEPGKLGRIDPERAHYDSSYRVSAAFLAYVTEKYDKQIVLKLNKSMREGKYNEGIFQRLTGKKLKDLDVEWRATVSRLSRKTERP